MSINNNPYYFNAPFSGVVVVPAAHNFIINLMSNHSAAEPNGYLDGEQLKTFFGISGQPGSFVWNKGQEQIPQNWYRRPSANPYDVAAVFADLGAQYAQYPETFKLGGNTGTTNSFTGVDVGNLTGGAYNAQTLMQGNNLGCFAFQALQVGLPDALHGVVANVAASVNLLNQYINPITTKLNCTPLQTYNQGLFNQFPGYSYNPSGQATNYRA